MNTSSHKKGILPVKLGQTEHDRIVDFFNVKGMEEEGMQRARDYNTQALNKARSF